MEKTELDNLLEKTNLKVTALAARLEISHQAVSSWRKIGIPPSRLPELRTITGLSYEEISPSFFTLNK